MCTDSLPGRVSSSVRLRACGLLFIGLFAALPASAQQQGDHPVLDAPGFQQNRDYFSAMSFEHIDTLGGGLVLTFTDLVLQGNAGRELRFQRTYNSKIGGWTFGIAGVALRISNPSIPLAETPTFQEATPALHMSDGSVRKMAWHGPPNINDPSSFNEAISSEFWHFNRAGSTRRLAIPNGDTCDYEAYSEPGMLRVTSCKDAFNNELKFEWATSAPQLKVTQRLNGPNGSIKREIALEFGYAPLFPRKMTYDGREWNYIPDEATHQLMFVTPPVGPGWAYTYDGLMEMEEGGEIVEIETTLIGTVTTPHGGVITYAYKNQEYEGPDSPAVEYHTAVVKSRSTSDNGIESGTWEYNYQITQNGISGITRVRTPSGRIKYQYGSSESPLAVFDGDAGIVPLASRAVQRPVIENPEIDNDGHWEDVESESLTYKLLSVLSWWNFGTLELEGRTITRHDGGTATHYATSLNYNLDNFGDYHRPMLITETGPAGTRSTVRSYQHYTSPYTPPYLVGLPLTEQVTVVGVGSQTFSKSWTYNSSNGFKIAETIYGITTEFDRDAFGNVASVKKANNKTTTFTYTRGQPRVIGTPEYAITRTINPDGTIESETRAGRKTTFTYDDLGRLLTTQPPGGTIPTVIEYDNTGGEWVRTTRGASQVTATLDGLGRPVRTINAVYVETQTLYDAEGRIVREGYPFRNVAPNSGADIWTEIQYDPLGRVTARVHPDYTGSTREYGPDGVVTVHDENGRQSVLTWQAFGNPDEPQLANMVDAENNVWSYEYNSLGRLKKVNAAGGITRTWTYDLKNLLEFETHPESGTTNYFYDIAGVLSSKTDANGTTTQYEYDDNERVRKVTAGTRETTITYEPGSDNRESATNLTAGVIWQYDTLTGRLRQRQDAINGKLFTTRFEYDGNDYLRAIAYPSGRYVQYDVNAEGQPTKVYETAAGRDYALGITYHASGGVASYAANNGTTTTIGYDQNRYWVRSIASGGLGLTYDDYDGVGNPHTIIDSRPGFDQSLGYDNLDRLTAATGPYGPSSYTYDAHGNRNSAAYQYETGTLRLANQSGTAFTYYNNGNTMAAGTAAYTYTPQNQLETATDIGVNATFGYDADDQRVKKTSGGATTYYVRGLTGELLTEWTDPGTVTGRLRDYVYLGTRLLSGVLRNTANDPAGYNIPQTKSHRFAKSWQVVNGMGSGAALLGGGITTAARKSSHPDMPRTGLRLGVKSEGTIDAITLGPTFGNNPEQPKQGGLFLEFEVERYPFLFDAEWLAVDGGGSLSSATDVLRLYITPSGTLVLKHDGSRVTPLTLWTSAPVGLGTRHTLELRFEYNAYTGPYASPNPQWENLTSWAQVYWDGALVAAYVADGMESNPLGLDVKNGLNYFAIAKLISPGPANGLLMNLSRVGLTAATNHGDSLDLYGTTWRTTLLEPAGAGTYSEWTGGQPDWRARSAMPGSGNIWAWTSTNITGKKISYAMESMLSRGITGTVGTVLVGVRMGGASPNTRAFIRRNGVETILTDLTLLASNFRWYRVAESGWAATDTIEIGVTSGDNDDNYLSTVALMVEHNTPEPAPLTDTAARVVTVNYTGNGGAQTIDLGGDLPPTVLFVLPANGATSGVEPLWWWDSRLGAGGLAQVSPDHSRIWPQKGKFQAVHTTTGDSYNANGVNYIAIALFDPAGRYVIPFAVSRPAGEDNYTHDLRYPQSAELATDFTPNFVFGGVAGGVAADVAGASTYRGPGHVGDLTAKLGVPASSSASVADRIQAIGAGTVQFGTAVGGHGNGDQAFWAGRVDDGVSSTRLMAVTSYVGDGTASRNILLNLSDEAPVFAMVVPTTATAKVYRVIGDTTGRNTSSGNAVANSITALGTNQLTVGIALNATGVTYDVWAITVGTVTPY